MRFLFCCEFYYPSVGGVQEVMRHIAERLVASGHEVTVATTALANRDFDQHNGVKIVEFGVTGNLVRGLVGDIDHYREFVRTFPCDAIMIKAAQQWTFDALWPVLDQISTRKVFIPCGFSGLYEPTYAQYFEQLPDVLRQFDHLIFYAEQYRDVDFAREHGLSHFTILANGACEREFTVARDPEFRRRNGIDEDSFVMLTVGSLTGVKGHREIAEAFATMSSGRRKVTLILNGNAPPRPAVDMQATPARAAAQGPVQKSRPLLTCLGHLIKRFFEVSVQKSRRLLTRLGHLIKRFFGLAYRSVGVLQREGWAGVKQRFAYLIMRVAGKLTPRIVVETVKPMEYWIEKAEKSPNKQVLLTDFGREELVQAYMNADLFVFASNIEYSPLVLFESVAAGTPFLSVPVGNAAEIARWTRGGVICTAPKDDRGYTRVDPEVLRNAIKEMMRKPGELEAMGAAGRQTWSEKYTWAAITKRYEQILLGKPD